MLLVDRNLASPNQDDKNVKQCCNCKELDPLAVDHVPFPQFALLAFTIRLDDHSTGQRHQVDY